MSTPSTAASEASEHRVPFVCPPDHKHDATSTCYKTHKCRCVPCGQSDTARKRDQYRQAAYGRWKPMVSPVRATAHLASLIAAGMTNIEIAAAAGVQPGTITRLLKGRAQRIYGETETAILRVEPGHAPYPWEAVDATGSIRRLQALIAMGYSHRTLSGMLGLHQKWVSHLLPLPTIREEQRIKVADLFEQLWDKPAPDSPTSRRALLHARKEGYVTALGWDDIDTDATPPTTERTDEDHWDNRLDHAAVQAAIDGHKPDLTPREREDVVRRLHSSAWSGQRIADWIGGNVKTVERIRVRLGLRTLNQNDLIDAA